MTHSTKFRVILSKIERMRIKKPPGGLMLILLTVLLAPLFVLGFRYARISDTLPSRNIDIEINSLPVLGQSMDLSSFWSVIDKIYEKDDELAKVPVSIGTWETIYYEDRVSFFSDGTESVVRKRLSDKERVLGLKLLNTETGEVQVLKVNTKITRDGVSIIAPAGYQIKIEKRPNGIGWNYWNTLYHVVVPENMVVIKNNFPMRETFTSSIVVNGRVRQNTRKVVKGFLYVPYSSYLKQEVVVKVGREYLQNVVALAFAALRERGVSGLNSLPPRFFERLPLLEQGDLTEFILDPQNTTERVLVIISTNKERSWTRTCNSSSACGWVQFTPGTYAYMRRSYPAAKLIPNFIEGAADHVNSIMAAILLYKSNLDNLVQRYGEDIIDDPRLEEYLAAGYNGSPRWVHQSLDATLGKIVDDWTKHLRRETHGFMTKLRYLIDNDLP